MPNSSVKVMLEEPLMGVDRRPTPPFSWVRWEWIFFANVFMACVSFSIVLPSLWLYLSALDGSQEFYAWVVAAFSIGEAIGSIALGALSNWAGTKPTLRLCCVLAISGAAMYSLASFAFEHVSAPAAPYIVFVGRLLQGIGSGGQQAVEQSYLSIAAPPSQRTELTSKLSTFACLGFIFGPAVGALVATMPAFSVGALHFDAYTMQGWCIVAMNLVMFADLELFVDVSGAPEARKTQGGGGGDGETAAPWQSTPTKAAAGLGTPTTRMQTEAAAGGGAVLWEVWACILFFFVHFNGFAVQETITTPLVQDWFGWGEMHANLLFTGAGAANLLMAVLMAALTAPRAGGGGQLVEDRVLLVISLVLSVAGWVLMVPPDAVGGPPMGLPQFFVAFALVTVSFPVGRGVCLAMVGKLLGKQPQGGWMGLMFAFGSVARMAGPFWAVHGFLSLGALAVFGSTAVTFAVSLAAAWALWERLAAADGEPSPQTAGGRASMQGIPSPRFSSVSSPALGLDTGDEASPLPRAMLP